MSVEAWERAHTGGPAYPVPEYLDATGDYPTAEQVAEPGLDVLDHFAGLALARVAQRMDWRAEREHGGDDGRAVCGAIARDCYRLAAAMVAERERLRVERKAAWAAELSRLREEAAAARERGEPVDD